MELVGKKESGPGGKGEISAREHMPLVYGTDRTHPGNRGQRQRVATFRAYIFGENGRAFRVVGALFATMHPQWNGSVCLDQAPTAALRPTGRCRG